ncbi:MAG TPA: GerMN domain-containing protein [Mycobacteriales bacterium]|jgi:hypothetical protein|nr:GerMN domain-containing protein [Mycobacteriales bacterium]
MRRLVALAAAAATLCAGCGLPHGHDPQPIDRSRVPFGLLQPLQRTPTAPQRGPLSPLYFVHGKRLTAVPTHIQGLPVAADILRQLLVGPTPAQSRAGDATFIPPRTALLSLRVAGGTASVNLSRAFAQSTGSSDQVRAVAQIVYTLTARRPIERVSFAIEGRKIEVPDARGRLSAKPRSRADYRSLAPP